MGTGQTHRTSGRATGFLAVGIVLYFLTLLLALYVMDRQVYGSAKHDLVRDNFRHLFNLPDSLNDQARTALFSSSENSRTDALSRLRKTLSSVVHGDSSMYRMELRSPENELVLEVENLPKLKTHNTWDNNLFVRSFSARTSQFVSRYAGSSEDKPGQLVGYFTSPANYLPIETLTFRYRTYAGFLIAGWILIYIILYRSLLRPVRNVTLHLDRSRNGQASLIPAASGTLETGYNDMAARALLQQLEEKLNEPARPGSELDDATRRQIVQESVHTVARAFKVRRIQVQLGTAGEDNAAQDLYNSLPNDSLWAPWDDARSIWTSYTWSGAAVSTVTELAAFKAHYNLPVGPLELRGVFTSPAAMQWLAHVLRFGEILGNSLAAYQALKEHTFRQRSEANINLSRNIGHDLTNIIATSKLDLMAIRQLLNKSSAPADDPRAELIAQSVKGLLESTRLMQEMVNVYRAFSYVKRPAYERRELRSVIEEFLASFEPAMSARVSIRRHLETPMQPPIVEPRLLKLALFNVFQNALDAFKRRETAEAAILEITLQFDPASQTYHIIVEDNGPGLRDLEGRLLSAAEAQRVLDYGYTTKGETGEGLGLSWVRTIMADFHDGGVRAENRPDCAGTRMTLWLKSMERSEAKVQQ